MRYNAAVHSELFSDLFVSFQGGDTTGLFFDVKINPLISWLWAGFGVLLVGTSIAAWPRKDRHLAVAPVAPARSAPSRKKRA